MANVSQRAQGLGTENAFIVLAEVNKLIREGRDVISFCIGQPDFHTPMNIQDAGVKAIREGRHGYTPSAGIAELRSMPMTWWWLRVRNHLSPTRFFRPPTTARAMK